MEKIVHILSLIFIELFFFVIQLSGLVTFFGLRVNLLLIFFIICIITQKDKIDLFIFLIVFLFLMTLHFSLWFFSALFFVLIIILSFLIKKSLTGHILIDFLILTFFSTIAFLYGTELIHSVILNGFVFTDIVFSSLSLFFYEFVLNIIFGGIIIFLSRFKPFSYIFYS